MKQQKMLWVFLSLFLVLIIDAMGFSIVFPVVGSLFLQPDHGLLPNVNSMVMRDLFYGLSLICFFVCMLFGAPFFGDLSDRLGRKRVILICLFGTGLAYLFGVVGVAISSISLFLLGRCVAGFLAGSQSIAQAAIIDISTPENKTTNLALITLASCLGWAIGPLLGGIFSSDGYFACMLLLVKRGL